MCLGNDIEGDLHLLNPDLPKDLYGNKITKNGYLRKSPGCCEDDCKNTKGCVAWEWGHNGESTYQAGGGCKCWLKSSMPTCSPRTGYVAGNRDSCDNWQGGKFKLIF